LETNYNQQIAQSCHVCSKDTKIV